MASSHSSFTEWDWQNMHLVRWDSGYFNNVCATIHGETVWITALRNETLEVVASPV